MLVEKKIGRLSDYPGYDVQYVDIEWFECHKKINKKTLPSGEEIGIRLSDHDARHGLDQDDVLAVIDKQVIAVNVSECDALVINCPDDLIPKACYEIGNRHAPFFHGEHKGEFYTPFDKPIMVMLEKLGVNVKTASVKLNKGRAISSSTGSHGHDHGGHDGNHDHSHSHAH